ncbi:MAG TPA: hypothetical protein VN721_04855 [Flavipsychrobacter sp.]|nr:hypothetical protein [Flavipsychrobacter sp.]
MINSNLFSTADRGFKLKNVISYKVFGLKAMAEVAKRFEAGAVIYNCKLQYGGEVEIMKVEDKWIDIQTDEFSSLAKSLGEGIEQIEALPSC